MKKVILAAAVMLSVLGTSVAQQGPRDQKDIPVEQRVEKTTAKLKETVTLSEDQWSSLSAIYTKHFNEMDALRQQGSERPDREQMQALQASRNAEIKALVGEENLKKIQEAEKGMGGPGKRGGKRGSK
ncbi:hypothetical protein MKJ04_06550 [Pontibacter sp. E15-1]|uniref:hypothetical protein n=1 Tax=Pontibacter sp. E15-1 TaxID=2919918 RepID=UPI001F501ACB|nr:hypothetical protein [Pontibacter sp. E15-1]MCJ8164500.1 hypothetical protein [Pontibacter sp. E15-1]